MEESPARHLKKLDKYVNETETPKRSKKMAVSMAAKCMGNLLVPLVFEPRTKKRKSKYIKPDAVVPIS